MRDAIFRQYDSRWGSLPYPTKSYSFAGSGCGCCACTHLIIEFDKYKNYTPKNIRPYMVEQGFATKGNGTLWDGITKTLKHYGFKPKNIPDMADVWKECNKGNRAGILLFRAGTKGGVTWTSGGHYVAFLDYKVVNGKHYFYTKDSGARKNDGWHCYETQMKGLIKQIWVVELPSEVEYYKKCKSNENSLVDGLKYIGVSSSKATRTKIAKANGIKSYAGTAKQNTELLQLLKKGNLKKF